MAGKRMKFKHIDEDGCIASEAGHGLIDKIRIVSDEFLKDNKGLVGAEIELIAQCVGKEFSDALGNFDEDDENFESPF